MVEEIKSQPEVQPEGQETEPKETVVKSAEEMVKDLTESQNKLTKDLEETKKRVEDKESFIGRQATELGELRKMQEQYQKINSENTEAKDKLLDEMTQTLMEKDGMDEETAKYNAKLLVKRGGAIIEAKLKETAQQDLVDMVEDALEDGIIDKKAYEENKDEILSEFRGRKHAPTARGNYRIFKKVAKDIIQKKADVMKAEKNKESEEKRDGMIAGTTQPQSKRKQEEVEAEKKETDSILNAGSKRNNAFF